MGRIPPDRSQLCDGRYLAIGDQDPFTFKLLVVRTGFTYDGKALPDAVHATAAEAVPEGTTSTLRGHIYEREQLAVAFVEFEVRCAAQCTTSRVRQEE